MKSNNDEILKILRTAYPDVKTQLNHRNAYELLVATILSAQCTDVRVNAVTPKLFARLPDPPAFAAASIETIEALIHSTGFYRNKAKQLKAGAQALVERFGATVPNSLDALVTLPGVGRKTANVVLGACFGIPGIVVDTHVARVSSRLGLTENKQPERIETDLMDLVPKSQWSVFSLQLVYHGRAVCKARKPACLKCLLCSVCAYPEKSGG